jgi:predicted O-methyltransferase YrrM
MALLSSRTFTLLRDSHASFGQIARHWRFKLDRALKRTGAHATSPQIEAARARFVTDAAHGEFTTTWFDDSIPVWVPLLAPHAAQQPPAQVLEIGAWEGRSTVFLLSYLQGCHVTAVDSWAGGDEHATWDSVSGTERRFDHNVSRCPGRVRKAHGLSRDVLPALLREAPAERFDVVYIDGSHFADDVLLDALHGWRLLKVGGTLLFDDYLWSWGPYRGKRNPAAAIHLFLKLVADDHVVLHAGYQLAVRKTRSLAEYTQAA